MREITARQLAILTHFVDLPSPPTMRDLMARFGWRSTNAARDHLRALCAKGFMRRSREHGQSFRYVPTARGVREVVAHSSLEALDDNTVIALTFLQGRMDALAAQGADARPLRRAIQLLTLRDEQPPA